MKLSFESLAPVAATLLLALSEPNSAETDARLSKARALAERAANSPHGSSVAEQAQALLDQLDAAQ
ncbi:hypothetical protein [Haliangium sp.]|uniref:hypothetical protein n=1 Tax=Haliangium sp. TaxID=2663208 RepID=UPI003D1142F3